MEASEAARLGLVSPLVMRSINQNLLGHLVVNWIGWSLGLAIVIRLWRSSYKEVVQATLFILAILVIAYVLSEA